MNDTRTSDTQGAGTADDPTGFDAAPVRYMATGREAIDIIRERLGDDDKFVGFCRGNALKYELRAGHKAGAPAEQDLDKARWYREMADHVLFGSPDPRAQRAQGAGAGSAASEGGAA